MYITPNSTIKLYKGVALDSAYEHTIRFANRAAQDSFFAAHVKYTFENYTFIGKKSATGRDAVAIECPIGDLYDCTYMAFQNKAFSNKWFYAFITDLEYKNNETTIVYFEVDILQSWYFEWSFGTCLVEREHVYEDSRTAYLQPEPIETGERVVRNLKPTGFTSAGAAIAIIGPNEGTPTAPYDGETKVRIYSTMRIRYFTTAAAANEYLNSIYDADKAQDLLVGAYMVPLPFAAGAPGGITHAYSASNPSTVDGYSPKNLKVLSSLYNNCFVTNGQGSAYTLDYSKFSNGINFEWVMTVQGGVPEAIFYPTSYAGSTNDMSHKLSINNFPQCPIDSVSYKDFMSRQAAKLEQVGTAVGALIGSAGGVVGAGVGAAIGGGIAGAIGNIATAWTPQSASAGSPSCAADWANGTLDFYVGQQCIKAANARSLDEFFEKFGYCINRLKTPNRASRPHWSYVKTKACTITGNVPSAVASRLEEIHNKGITYWQNGNEIGDYTLNNH